MNSENLSISEVASLLGTKPYLLRFYETEFELDVPRTQSRRRYYTPKEVNQLRYIYKLKNDGIKNKEIKTVLSTPRMDENIFEFPEDERPVSEKSVDELLDEKENALKEIAVTIASLKRDMEEIKAMYNPTTPLGVDADAQNLLDENEGLKQRLKEKTYELVELKEKIKNTKKSRLFFR